MTMFDKKRIQNIISQFDCKQHKNRNSVQIENVIAISIASAAAGALLGVLFAPEKGKKTRENLAKKSNEIFKEVKNSTDKLKNKLDSNMEKSRETVQRLSEDVEDYAEWTFQELYDEAKKLKIKGYSTMNKSELIQAIEDL